MNKNKIKPILVLHGPNMNLLGMRQFIESGTITLDKLNRHIRKIAKNYDLQIKTLQTNEEGKAVTILQKHRNRISAVLLFPGPWQASGLVLKETLAILNIPFITISQGEVPQQLIGAMNVYNDNLYIAVEIAIKKLSSLN